MTESVRRCHDCNGIRFVKDYESGDTTCLGCGLVHDRENIDISPEWRAFTGDEYEKRARVGAPSTFAIHDKGLSTAIGYENKDIHGKSLSPQQKGSFYRLRKWNKRARVQSPIERNLTYALSQIGIGCSTLFPGKTPPEVLEQASVNYRKAAENNLVRGRSIMGVAAASTYQACRDMEAPRSLDDVAKAFQVNKKEVARNQRFMGWELQKRGISVDKTRDAKKYVSKITNSLGISRSELIAYKIIDAAKKARISGGKDPRSISAASTYISSILSNERRTQREIAGVAGLTEVTVRNRFKELFGDEKKGTGGLEIEISL